MQKAVPVVLLDDILQEASEECHRRYCHDNGLLTYQEALAKSSL